MAITIYLEYVLLQKIISHGRRKRVGCVGQSLITFQTELIKFIDNNYYWKTHLLL